MQEATRRALTAYTARQYIADPETWAHDIDALVSRHQRPWGPIDDEMRQTLSEWLRWLHTMPGNEWPAKYLWYRRQRDLHPAAPQRLPYVEAAWIEWLGGRARWLFRRELELLAERGEVVIELYSGDPVRLYLDSNGELRETSLTSQPGTIVS